MYDIHVLNDHFLLAKIYYGQSIADEEWDNAYYMAPITGAVLSNILNDYIMEYPILHPRYQPFTVVEKQSGKAILNSSNSEDFVWNIFRKLADMYVAIDPILAPKRYDIQLIVEDVQRDVVRLDSNIVMTSNDVSNESGGTHERKQNVANLAAEFYHAFYSCVEAIKTGDYSTYKDTEIPTLAPSPSPSAAPTVKVTEFVTETITLQKNGGGGQTRHHKKKNATNTSAGKVKVNVNVTVVDDIESVDNNKSDEETRFLRPMNDVVEQIQDIESELDYEDADKIEINDNSPPSFVEDAKEAAEQAEVAAEAAKEAASSNEDGKAIEAAELAAEAAMKAAQATLDAVAEAEIETLLSGDGDMMAGVIQSCFSDPKFGITELGDEESELPRSTNAYLYVDGSHYYRLNLTAPFINVQSSIPTLPKQNMAPDGKSDVVDVGLAFGIIGGFCFGIIVMLHHIRVLNWDERLQFKWFFHPTGSAAKETKRGGYSNTATHEGNDDDSISIGGDLELSDRQIPNGMH